MFENNGLCVIKFLDQCYFLARAIRKEFCGIAMAYVLSDGSVYPCSYCAAVHRFLAGNLRQETFADIWENSFQDIRGIGYDDFKGCATCELAGHDYFCTSRCPVMSEILTGDPFECGATPYVKASLKSRRRLLQESGVLP
jgi:radical SAM protein with 4Fe4S-binding SPASM domain